MNGLASTNDVAEIAERVTEFAEQALKAAVAGIKAGKISEEEAQEVLALIQRIDRLAGDLNTFAVKSIVASLEISQQKLKDLVDTAKQRIQAIETAAKFIDMLADVLVFVAAAASGVPGPIIAASKALADDVGLQVP